MKVLYVCNDQHYFEAHRRWLADDAILRGMDVIIACGAAGAVSIEQGKVHIPLDIERHRFTMMRDLRLAIQIVNAAWQTKADVVHLITIKPILFGLLGLRLLPRPRRVVATFPGLGRVFDASETTAKARLRRWLVAKGLRIGLASPRVRAVFETEADRQRLLAYGVAKASQSFHIPGSGIDAQAYPPVPMPPGPLRVLFAGRLLRSKGVMQIVEAAGLLALRNVAVEVIVAGGEQRNDPDGLSESEMAKLSQDPAVRFLGAMDSAAMPALLGSVHAVLLPTAYQEGVPRILIEAAAVGRPAIVSKNPGCTAFIEDGTSGLVLKGEDPEALADAITQLVAEPGLLERLAKGAASRVRDGGFGISSVGAKTFALYNS